MPDTTRSTTICEHLRPVLDRLLDRGARVTFAGQAWSHNCRMWVYLDVVLDLAALRRDHQLEPCVVDHTHVGTHEGSEHGLVCTRCLNAIMGAVPREGPPGSSGSS